MGELDREIRMPAVPVAQRVRPLRPAEIAWIALIPCALATVAAMVVLGPPVGHLLFRPTTGLAGLWPPGWEESQGRPEAVKLGRYVVAVLAPFVLAAVVLVGVRRTPALRPQAARALALAGQALVLAVVLVALLGQRNVIPTAGRHLPMVFSPTTLAAAAVLVAIGVAAMRVHGVAERVRLLPRETTAWRLAAVTIAVAFAATWLAEGLYTDRIAEDKGWLDWTVNDAFAVLDGRTPLVNVHLLYAKLLPYPAALAMAVFGKTAIVYTGLTFALSVLSFLCVFAIFRRLTHSSLLALALFVPFVALSGVNQPMRLTAMFPMRYGGAYLMAWLTARSVDRRTSRHTWAVFLIGGVLAVDELEFGEAALLATVVALACARPPRTARDALRSAGNVAGGLLGAAVLVSLLTLVRAGDLPHPALLLEWPRIFTRLGWFSMPMPVASLHLAIYATLAAAIVVAAVRLARADRDVLLTSMLAWSGVFGLVAAGYYVGRSDDLKLVSMFSAWSFALSLLAIVCVRALAARRWRRPALAELLVLFGVAVSVCSITRTPLPQDQVARLTQASPPPRGRPANERFVRRHIPEHKVVLLVPMSERVAYELGRENVTPYPSQEGIVTRWQLQRVVGVARREGVRRILLANGRVAVPQLALLEQEGFALQIATPTWVMMGRR